ncbi:hypothetical protein GCM10007852_03050 [Agaribacter marinus]|uniref:Uncharacterized protein n=2 Tax=Agaribacter marinus TaxID=1431249 RepID=A0AA37SUF3_9ALTE|nr:hypothetical protein GCM10007852_03050 [Agaribacter marinus]
MKYFNGDRVRMIRHADWKQDAIATIVSTKPLKRALPDNTDDWEYWIEFDFPQYDLTDEMNDDRERSYDSCTVLERYLEPIKVDTT